MSRKRNILTVSSFQLQIDIAKLFHKIHIIVSTQTSGLCHTFIDFILIPCHILSSVNHNITAVDTQIRILPHFIIIAIIGFHTVITMITLIAGARFRFFPNISTRFRTNQIVTTLIDVVDQSCIARVGECLISFQCIRTIGELTRVVGVHFIKTARAPRKNTGNK